MTPSQVRKLVRGVRNAADFVLLQLHYSAPLIDQSQVVKQVNCLTYDSLRFALHALRENCDSFMWNDPLSLARIGQSVAALTSARSALQQELLWERDDHESMHLMQFTVLADGLRVLQERVMDAVDAGSQLTS
jgi:hypothetical protein